MLVCMCVTAFTEAGARTQVWAGGQHRRWEGAGYVLKKAVETCLWS